MANEEKAPTANEVRIQVQACPPLALPLLCSKVSKVRYTRQTWHQRMALIAQELQRALCFLVAFVAASII